MPATAARNSSNVDPADAVVGAVGDVEIPRANGEASGKANLCCRGRAAIAPEGRCPGTDDGGDGARRQVHPADAVANLSVENLVLKKGLG
jgi:hypothetical protein